MAGTATKRTSERPAQRREATPAPFTELELDRLELERPEGLTSHEILELLRGRGVSLTEATFRKYVQLGLLPRSRRVGRKGRHRGSCGMYPPETVRRVALIKSALANRVTIEEIQRSIVRFKDEIHAVEHNLRALIDGFEREVREAALEGGRRRELSREIVEAKRSAGELVRRIANLERQLAASLDAARGGAGASGGAEDLL